jgi:hypothetical protein
MSLIRWACRAGAAVALAASLSACIVAPIGHGHGQGYGYGAPEGVVYVAPTYAIPAPGYAWSYHGQFGWGWRHPQYGWHRGWR